MSTQSLFVWSACAAAALAGAAHAQQVRFAAFGDYGQTANSQAVATRVLSLNPDFIVTVGDNTYSTANTTANWDGAIGQYYHNYIKYPAGSTSAWVSQSSPTRRFFPAIGNHDMDVGNSPTSFTNYFDLPGNERHYTFTQGVVQVFVLSSDPREPSGVNVGGTQYSWLVQQLSLSTARWKIVAFHHPFQTSTTSSHGPSAYMNWGFESMGVSMVLQGHNHTMERISYGGIPWFVTGAGGQSHYTFTSTAPGSQFRNSSVYGFSLITADLNTLRHQFISAAGTVLDTFTVTNRCAADFNGDGVLDPDDLSDFIGAYFSVPAGPGSDFNRDGIIDPDDVSDYIGAFFGGAC